MAPARYLMLLALGMLAALQFASAATLNHRVLLITLDGSIDYTDFAQQACQAYGVPYDVVKLSTANADSYNYTSFLRTSTLDAAGQPIGKYSAILMYPNLEYYTNNGANSGLTWPQITQMRSYMTAYGVRRVIFGMYPPSLGASGDAAHAISLANAGAGSVSTEMLARFSMPALTAANTVTGSGINFTAVNAQGFSTLGLSKNPASSSGLGSAHTPIMTFDAAPTNFPSSTVAGVISAMPDYYGLSFQQMSFFFDCAAWNLNCILLNHLWLGWALRELVPGERRCYLNTQVDDLLLSTEGLSGKAFRISNTDLNVHLDWTDDVNRRLPAGSAYKVEFVINGNGALEFGQPDITSDIGEAISAAGNESWPKTFAKPNGTGTDMAYDASNTADPDLWTTGLDPNQWNFTAIAAADPLSKALYSDSRTRNGFFWGSHTWSHQEQDNTTYHDAKIQHSVNMKMLKGANFFNMAALPTWSASAMVTPAISGLLNADHVRAMREEGILAAMGDNTYPGLLLNADHPWQAETTDLARFNHVGYTILPRFATEVYYLVSMVKEEQTQYDIFYYSYFGKNSTWLEILQRESDRVVRAMLSLRHDAHMFHQANLRTDFTGTGDLKYAYPWSGPTPKSYSLLQAWVEQMVYRYKSLVTWPVVSIKLDDLFAKFQERKVRDDCNFNYQFTTGTNGTVSSVTVTSGAASGKSCKAPLIAPTAGSGTGVSIQTLGNEYPTSYCSFTSGSSCTINLPTAVTWTN